MPKITISETDLTRAGTSEVLNNIVYIPGYAITGPVNTPTLCNTLNEFINLFGDEAYIFESDQTVNYGSMKNQIYAYKGDYEKSYFYASELLNKGLPVLFERFMPSDKVDSRTAKLSINTTSDNKEFIISALYPGKYGSKIEYKITAPTVTISNDINITSAGASIYAGSTLASGSKVNGSEISKDTLYSKSVTLVENDIIKAGSKLTVGYKIGTEINKDYTAIYELLINNTETLSISFDPNSKDYYVNKTSKYITFTNKTLRNINLVLNDLSGNLELEDNTSDEFSLSEFYTNLKDKTNNIFNKIADNKDLYNVKTITCGSYPSFALTSTATDGATIAEIMVKTAKECTDATAIIDYYDDGTDTYTNVNLTWLSELNTKKYGAMFTPYGTYQSTIDSKNSFRMPASFGYLSCLADSIKTNPNWYAVAGVTRGKLRSLLAVDKEISTAEADKMQSRTGISINPILNIPGHKYCIWGNRTLNENEEGLTASSFLNIRVLVNDVKKVVYKAAKELTFELNNDILWLNFKAKIEPTLDKMLSGNGLSGYKIIKVATDKKATIKAIIRLYPIEAVEDFDITIELADSYTTIE